MTERGPCGRIFVLIIGESMRYDFLVDTYDTERLKVAFTPSTDTSGTQPKPSSIARVWRQA
jgi:hypothetical protein